MTEPHGESTLEDTSSEQYIFLGTQTRHHFFLHVIRNPAQFKRSITYGLYQVLWDKEFLDRTDQTVVVYEFDVTGRTVHVVCLQRGGDDITKLDPDNLAQGFPILITASREHIYLVRFLYEAAGYDHICVPAPPLLIQGLAAQSQRDDAIRIDRVTILRV